ncbi:MAG TPA: primosomal protein N', partial [Rhabdochlamydiaceae bacterium]
MYASVLLDSGIDKALDYSVPEEMRAQALPGMRVLVPLRGSLRKGILSAVKETSTVSKVQPLAQILSDEPLISKELFEIAYWISHYYCTPLRRVLKSFLPPGVRKAVNPKVQLFVKACLSKNEIAKLCDSLRSTDAPQAKVLEVLLTSFPGMLLSHLLEKADVSKSPVTSLVKKKIVTCGPLESEKEFAYFQ